jgi:hypothetical protein
VELNGSTTDGVVDRNEDEPEPPTTPIGGAATLEFGSELGSTSIDTMERQAWREKLDERLRQDRVDNLKSFFSQIEETWKTLAEDAADSNVPIKRIYEKGHSLSCQCSLMARLLAGTGATEAPGHPLEEQHFPLPTRMRQAIARAVFPSLSSACD